MLLLCFVAGAGAGLFRRLRSALRDVIAGFIEAQRRIFVENTTTAIAGHTLYELVAVLAAADAARCGISSTRSPTNVSQAIVFLGNPLILWPALIALGICLRDFIVARRSARRS